jgi:hypothetical protein
MLRPEHDLSERVEQLLFLRNNGPDACPHGYEEADCDEYACTAAVSSAHLLFPLANVYVCATGELMTVFSICITGVARTAALHAAALDENIGFRFSHLAEHSGLIRLMVQGSCTLAH